MKLFKLYLFLLFILGINSCLQAQTKQAPIKVLPSILKDSYLNPMAPKIRKIRHKIDHVVSYCNYCGPTKENLLYFDSTGLLIARYIGPWIRNAIAPPGPTSAIIYTILNPASSFFFKGNDSQCYYYNARKKKTEQLPYKHQCESDGLVAVQRIKDNKCAYLNKKAAPICAFIYEETHSFEQGIAIVKRAGKEGVINTTGKEIVPCIYQDIRILDYNQIEAKKGYRDFDFFNKKGKPILAPKE